MRGSLYHVGSEDGSALYQLPKIGGGVVVMSGGEVEVRRSGRTRSVLAEAEDDPGNEVPILQMMLSAYTGFFLRSSYCPKIGPWRTNYFC